MLFNKYKSHRGGVSTGTADPQLTGVLVQENVKPADSASTNSEDIQECYGIITEQKNKEKSVFKTIQILIGAAMWLIHINASYAATQWTPPTKVTHFYPQQNTYIRLETAYVNPAQCAHTHYYVLDASHAQYEIFQRVLLTALASGKEVRIQVDADPGDCNGIYPNILKLYILH